MKDLITVTLCDWENEELYDRVTLWRMEDCVMTEFRKVNVKVEDFLVREWHRVYEKMKDWRMMTE